MDVNEMPTDQFMALPEDQQEMLMRGQALPEAPAEEPQAPEQETPAPAVEEVPAAAPEAPAQPERRGDPEVPLRQTREELRQAQAALKEREDYLARLAEEMNNPDLVEAHLRKLRPGQAPDYDLDPQGAIQHHLAPLQEQVQTLAQELQRERGLRAQQELMVQMHDKHGKDFSSVLQAFDASNPHLADLHPELRFLAAKGLQASTPPDPAAEQERIKAAAEALLAQQLKSGKVPVQTLGGAPPSRPVGQEQEYDPNMSQEEFDKLPDHLVRAMGRNLGKK
jgi:hypothetical protein